MSDKQHIPHIPVTDAETILVTKAGLAKALNVSERTVGNWQKRGVVPFLKISPRFVRFDLAEVRAALDHRYKIQAKTKNQTGVGR